jgi:PKD repeat protein
MRLHSKDAVSSAEESRDCREARAAGKPEGLTLSGARKRTQAMTAFVATLLVALATSTSAAASMKQLHAEPATASSPPFSLALAPRSVPLRVPNPQAYAAAKATANRAYLGWRARHPSTRTKAGARSPQPNAATAFAAPPPRAVLYEELNTPGIGADGTVTPPDTTGAIGPNNYVEFVNSHIAVYGRTLGAPLAEETGDEFSKGTSTCDGQIRWDQQAERWEYASLDCGETEATKQRFNFGWSKTADPTNLSDSAWCKYELPTASVLADYPKLGGDDNWMIIGTNGYEMPAGTFVGSKVYIVPKPARGSTECPSVPVSEGAVPGFTPVGANTSGSSSTGYVVAGQYNESGAAEHLTLFAIGNEGGTPTLKEEPAISVSSYYIPPGVPQPGSTDVIDSSDTRLTQAVAAEDPKLHKMAVWTQHAVSTSPGAPSVVRWYEVVAGSSTPVQEGTVAASAGNFAFNGAISPTTKGNGAAIDYNIGGPTQQVELHAQSRGPTTPVGAMAGDIKLAESAAIDTDFSCPSVTGLSRPCRWGDYAGASPDPAHPGVVWGTGEVNGPTVAGNGAQWKTENFALAVHAPAIAAFSVTTTTPTGGVPVSFDGSTSSDAGEPIASYEWSFGDGIAGSGEKPAHTYARPGTYTVKLTVVDEAGFTSTVEHPVIVADTPPTPAFAVTSAAPTATAPVSFDGSASHDLDGTIASYEWSFGDGATAHGEVVPSHVYALHGNYTVTLTVVDDGGKTASVSHAITVADAGPSASFSTGASPTAGLPVAFDGSGSKDPDGTVAGYAWSFGDGSNGSGAQATHVYTKAGAYPVKLTVADNGGLGAVTEHMITVALPSNAIRITGSSPNTKTGSLALNVLVPGPGVLGASDASKGKAKPRKKAPKALVKPVSMTVSNAGTVTLQIVPSSAGLAELKRKHKLSVKLSIAFTPTDGTQARTVKTVVLRMATRKKKK